MIDDPLSFSNDRCRCGHHAYVHTPTGRMDDTRERGTGPCTAGGWDSPCRCTAYEKRTR